MELTRNTTSQGVLCTECQSFFGSAESQGLCSSCWRKRAKDTPETEPSNGNDTVITENLDTMVSMKPICETVTQTKKVAKRKKEEKIYLCIIRL